MQPVYPASQSHPPDDIEPPDATALPRRSRMSARPGPHRRSAPMERVLAVLSYSIPLAPGAWLLLRERESRFLRWHAAQSLVFFALVAAAQIALYLLLMIAGGLIHSTSVAIVAAIVVVVLFAALGLCVLLVWLRLVGDCIDGRARRFPLLGRWAERLERAVGPGRRP